ncbi:MAG: LamG-like jellyroll fold domain-containing protein [Nostoc sp.]|uniref:LamG-like jellyroll fold domain-containing protein n=1 Tax=Nostoc sp. TaxID=1180 RepID=UPI002FF5B346
MAKSSKKRSKAPLEPAIESVLTFDGQDDYIELPPASIPSGNAITCSFWAYGGDALPTANSVVCALDANGTRLLNIHLPWNNSVIFFDCGNNDGSYDRIDKQAQPNDYKGKWSHWAFTKDVTTGEMKIYLNGELWHSGTGKTFALPKTVNAQLGSYSGSHFYQGKLAEVQLWSRERTQAEIQQDMHRRLVGDEPGLVSYWPLNEGVGMIAQDQTDNANHGTIHGNPSWEPSTLSLVDAIPSPSENQEASGSPEIAKVKRTASTTTTDNTIKFGDTFYLKHVSGQYLVAVDRGQYNYPQLGNTGKVALQLIGGREGEVVNSPSRIKIKTTESVTANNNILGAFANSHDCYYWSDGYDEEKQSWLITKVSDKAGPICYEDRIYLTNCSYTNQNLIADTNTPGYITTAENVGDWWVVESTVSSPSASTKSSSVPVMTEVGPAGSSISATAFAIQPKTGAEAAKIYSVSLSSGWAVDRIQVQYELATNPAETYDSDAFGGKGGGLTSFRLATGDYLTSVSGTWGAQAPGYPREEIISLQFHTHQGNQSQVFGGGNSQKQVEPFTLVAPEGSEIIGFFGACGSHQNGLVRVGLYTRPIQTATPVIAPTEAVLIETPASEDSTLPMMTPTIHLPTGSRIKFKSWKGDYLHRPDAVQGVTTWSTGIGNEWTVEAIADNKIKLKSWKGDYLHRPDAVQGVTTESTGIGNEWTVEAIADNKIKLKSWKGDYLHRPDAVQGVTTWNTGIGNEWEVEFMTAVLQFDGLTNYIEIPHSSVLGLTKSFTIEAWFNAQTLEGYRRICSKFPGFGCGLVGNSLLFTIYWVQDYTAAAQLTAGTWYHLAVVFDMTNTASIYLDGALVQTIAGESPASVTTSALELGRKAEGHGEYFHGQLAEIRIWDYAKTAVQIQVDKSYRLVGNEPHLIGYWPLNEGSGAKTVQDKTSNANHGTIQGNVVWVNSSLELAAADPKRDRGLVIDAVQEAKQSAAPAGTKGSMSAALLPIIIEMEPQTVTAIEALLAKGTGSIYNSVDSVIDQMKEQGALSVDATPVFVVIAGAAVPTA